MFFDIQIVVAGIVLLTAPSMYDGVVDPKAAFYSAAAVSSPTSKAGTYEIDIPAHETKLEIVDMTGQMNPQIANNQLRLNHQRVYFGKRDSTALPCNPMDGGAELTASAVNIPRLSTILKTLPKLKSNARPQASDDFTNMKTGPVSGWLDLPAGKLRSLHPSLTDDVVEFRPSERLARLASAVFMTLDSGAINCMVVMPFDGSSKTTYTFPANDFTIIFKNTMVPQTGHVVPGVGYDFELLYDLLETKDSVPPVPYALVPASTVGPMPAPPPPTPGSPHAVGEHINTQTGVNCGPPGH